MFWNVFKKEWKDSLRDRKTLLLSVFIPMLLTVGLAFFYEYVILNPEKDSSIVVAVENNLTKEDYSLLEGISGVGLLKVDDPVETARNGDAKVALIMEKGIAQSIATGGNGLVTIYADESSISSSNASEYLSNELSKIKAQLVEERLNAMGVDPITVRPLEIKNESLQNKDGGSLIMISTLLPLIIVLSVMLGGFPAAIDLFAGEKERKTMEALLITPVKRTTLIFAKWLTIASVSMMSGIVSILSFTLVVKLMTERMAEAFTFGANLGPILISTFLGIFFFSLLFSSFELIVSLVANSFKEASNYISPLYFVCLFPYFILTGKTPNEFGIQHFLIPVMNIYALFKELIYGIFSVQSILMVGVSSSAAILVVFTIASWMFKKDKWVLSK